MSELNEVGQRIANKVSDVLVEEIFSDETRDEVVRELNEKINIPLVGEEKEAEILTGAWELIEGILRKKFKLTAGD